MDRFTFLLALTVVGFGIQFHSAAGEKGFVPLFNGKDFAVIRRRVTTEAYLDYEDMPDWLEDDES